MSAKMSLHLAMETTVMGATYWAPDGRAPYTTLGLCDTSDNGVVVFLNRGQLDRLAIVVAEAIRAHEKAEGARLVALSENMRAKGLAVLAEGFDNLLGGQ